MLLVCDYTSVADYLTRYMIASDVNIILLHQKQIEEPSKYPVTHTMKRCRQQRDRSQNNTPIPGFYQATGHFWRKENRALLPPRTEICAAVKVMVDDGRQQQCYHRRQEAVWNERCPIGQRASKSAIGDQCSVVCAEGIGPLEFSGLYGHRYTCFA